MPDLSMIQTVEGSIPDVCERAARHVASQAHRLGATNADLREVLEALGLLKPSDQAPTGARDSLGRSRGQSGPGTPVGVPPGENGHNGMCASGDHPWIDANIAVDRVKGKRTCQQCANRRRRNRNAAKRGAA